MSKSVLVLNSTGRVGQGVLKALQDAGGFTVYGMTRGGSGIKTVESFGAKAVLGNYTDALDLSRVLAESGAKNVFMITDTFKAAKGKAKVEVEQGKIMVQTFVKAKVDFLVFASAVNANTAPAKAEHFHSKAELEVCIKESGLDHGILRLGPFFENFNDPSNWNPLSKRSVKGLWGKQYKVKYVSAKDIGKGAAVMFANPDEWKGKSIDALTWEGDGADLEAALTRASGEPSKYSIGLPRFLLWLMSGDLYAMTVYFEAGGLNDINVEPFRKMIGDYEDAEKWFKSVGKWSNGQKFEALK